MRTIGQAFSESYGRARLGKLAEYEELRRARDEDRQRQEAQDTKTQASLNTYFANPNNWPDNENDPRKQDIARWGAVENEILGRKGQPPIQRQDPTDAIIQKVTGQNALDRMEGKAGPGSLFFALLAEGISPSKLNRYATTGQMRDRAAAKAAQLPDEGAPAGEPAKLYPGEEKAQPQWQPGVGPSAPPVEEGFLPADRYFNEVVEPRVAPKPEDRDKREDNYLQQREYTDKRNKETGRVDYQALALEATSAAKLDLTMYKGLPENSPRAMAAYIEEREAELTAPPTLPTQWEKGLPQILAALPDPSWRQKPDGTPKKHWYDFTDPTNREIFRRVEMEPPTTLQDAAIAVRAEEERAKKEARITAEATEKLRIAREHLKARWAQIGISQQTANRLASALDKGLLAMQRADLKEGREALRDLQKERRGLSQVDWGEDTADKRAALAEIDAAITPLVDYLSGMGEDVAQEDADINAMLEGVGLR